MGVPPALRAPIFVLGALARGAMAPPSDLAMQLLTVADVVPSPLPPRGSVF